MSPHGIAGPVDRSSRNSGNKCQKLVIPLIVSNFVLFWRPLYVDFVDVVTHKNTTTSKRYTLCLKIPPTCRICYNSYVHSSIVTIFGTNVAEKVGSQNVLYFPTSPNYCFCTTWGNRKPGNCVFSLKCCMLFHQKHETQLKISPGQSWNTLQCQNDRLGASDRPRNGA